MSQCWPVHTLEELKAVCRFMVEFGHPWWVAGGWAADAWIGRPSREHEDIEIGILRADQDAAFIWLSDWQFFTPVNDQWAPLPDGERLEFPRAMLQMRRTPATRVTIDGMPAEFEFLLNDVAEGEWIFRHAPGIRVPMEQAVVLSPLGLPVVRPEILLLHKAGSHRPKDQHDFGLLRDRLGPKSRRWLRTTLARWRPDDPWLGELE